MHVRVDEPGQQQPAAQVGDRLLRVLGVQRRERAAGVDDAVPDEQPAVLFGGQRVGGIPGERVTRGVDDGATKKRHKMPHD